MADTHFFLASAVTAPQSSDEDKYYLVDAPFSDCNSKLYSVSQSYKSPISDFRKALVFRVDGRTVGETVHSIGRLATVALAFNFLLAKSLEAKAAEGPSVDQVKGMITEHMHTLISPGFTEREVTFQDVRPGTPYSDVSGLRTQAQTRYPFQVTLTLKDYEPGYPPNHYYGSTCFSHLTKSIFTVTADDFGGWAIEGAWTPTDKDCKPNPPR